MNKNQGPLGAFSHKIKEVNLYILASLALVVLGMVCVSLGSVKIPLEDLVSSFAGLFSGQAISGPTANIIFHLRIPRVVGACLVGASLSIAGAIMQGILKNPLADGSTLGVSGAASLGGVLAIVSGFNVPLIPYSGVVIMSIGFAGLSLVLIIRLAYKLDRTVSNNTIILLGIIFSMLTASALNVIMMAHREDLQSIVSWTMGSLAGTNYKECLILLVSLLIFGSLSLARADELNAFALGEEKARNIGVNVEKTKKSLLFSASSLVGISVAIGGNIAFVGIIIPHLVRLALGPNFRKVLPMSFFLGGAFLMVADLVSRSIFAPLELPIGTISSLVGTLGFVLIYLKEKR